MPQRTEDVYGGLQAGKPDREMYMKYPFYGQEEPFLVKNLAESWLLDIKDMMKPSVYARYHGYTEKYILPYVGTMQAAVFDKTALSAMLALLRAGHSQKEPLSQYMVYFVENMVRAMFRYGAEKHLVPEISFGKSEYKIQNKKYAMPLTELEIMQLVHAVEQQELDFQIQIMLPLYTGVSLSELCCLKWKDIDMKKDRIYIRRRLMRIQHRAKVTGHNHGDGAIENGSMAGTIKQGRTETVLVECELPEASCRDFIMPGKISALLQAMTIMKNPAKEKYVAEVEKKEDKADKTSAKISKTGTVAKILPPDASVLQCRLKAAGEQAGIPDLTYQTLRDTFAVMSLHAGGDVYNVACVMGIDVSMACERYGPWLVMNDGFMKEIG